MRKIHDVVSVSVTGPHSIRLRFSDGLVGEVDVAKVVAFDGVFSALNDPEAFALVTVDPELGTIVWPGGADLDPVVLYREAMAANGDPGDLGP